VPENREQFDEVHRIWQLVNAVPKLPLSDGRERAGSDSLPIAGRPVTATPRHIAPAKRAFTISSLGLAATVAAGAYGLPAALQKADAEEISRRGVAPAVVSRKRVSYDAPTDITVEKVGTTVAWRPGRFEYHRVPLSQVIQDANRYSKRKLVLGDSAAGALLYSGTLFDRDVDDWIAGLEVIYPEIEVVMTEDAQVQIRTRAEFRLSKQ
jgi:ferric-dicitrate binding protein FerR (iron transport regulator)